MATELCEINWRLTWWTLFVRGWANAVVLVLLTFLIGGANAEPFRAGAFGQAPVLNFLFMLLIAPPIGGWGLPVGLYAMDKFFRFFFRDDPAFLRPVTFMVTLFCSLGDPLLYGLKSVFPSLLPIDGFRILNLTMIIVIRNPCRIDPPMQRHQ